MLPKVITEETQLTAAQWVEFAKTTYAAGEDHLNEIECQYRSECAFYGDAGPGQGLAVMNLKRDLAAMRARYAELTNGRDLPTDAYSPEY